MSTGQQSSYRSIKRQQVIVGYLCILPAILGLFIFTLGPLLYSLYLSFTDWTILKPKQWVGVR
jgi:multiple sugar transport system permease protein